MHCVLHFSLSQIILIPICLSYVIPDDGGASEIVAHQAFRQYLKYVKDRARLGVPASDESLIMVPKTITQNAGYDQQKTIVKLQQDDATSKRPVGIDITTGKYFFK